MRVVLSDLNQHFFVFYIAYSVFECSCVDNNMPSILISCLPPGRGKTSI